MNVNKFYRMLSCEKKVVMEESTVDYAEKSIAFYHGQALSMLSSSLKEGQTPEQIAEGVSSFLFKNSVENIVNSWEKEEQRKKYYNAVFRFLRWFKEREEILMEVNRNVQVALPVPDGVLSQMVSIISKTAGGEYVAYLLAFKCADKSQKGKGIHTHTATDLGSCIAKMGLEKRYPHIRIRLVYLFSDSDVSADGMAERLNILTTRQSNVFTEDYETFYDKKGIFDGEAFHSMVEEVLRTPLQRNCSLCAFSSYCKEEQNAQELGQVRDIKSDKEEVAYQVPVFSAEQNEVVTHVDGPIRVFAGPGSGKTATVVGRIQHLVQKAQVPAEFVLAITFSKEAARELQERLSALDLGGEVSVSTIHALAWKILTSHSEAPLQIMGEVERDFLISALLEAQDAPLANISYKKMDGENGTIRKLGRLALGYALSESEEERETLLRENRLGDDFERFAIRFMEMKRYGGYITFDEMVPCVLKLFLEKPDVGALYKERYWHVMVDEFQDISADQYAFILALCGKGNLMAVADDDQAIYKFRKGDSRFMRELDKQFPGLKTVFLKTNYRSRPEIVTLSSALIKKNNERMDKMLSSARQKGGKIKLYDSTALLEQAVKDTLAEGYGLGDIAIIANKNGTLEEINQQGKIPCVLQKNYLRNSALFRVSYYLLDLIHSAFTHEESLFHLLRIFGIAVEKGVGSLYEQVLRTCSKGTKKESDFLQMLSDMTALASSCPQPDVFIEAVALKVAAKNTEVAFQTLCQMMEEQKIVTLPALQKRMRHMLEYEDQTMLPVSHDNEVLLITAHESKGLEFPVVIVVDDFGKEATEESRRVFYVALTRSKENLKVIKSSGCFAVEVERSLEAC